MLPLRDNVPTRGFPIVTVGLIVANALVWLWEVSGTTVNVDVAHWSWYPCAVQGPCIDQATDHKSIVVMLFTSMFMHGSWVHIGGNMLFLWIFGNNVEDALGKLRFLVFYLLAGVAATGLQTAVTLLTTSGALDRSIPNVGASGAIAGVLGAYLLLLPRARVLTLFIVGLIFLREIRAIWFLGVWFLFQLLEGGFSVLHPQAGGGVAFFAHVGGFAFGLLTVYAFAKRRPLQPKY